MRPALYPAAEELVCNKKQRKLEEAEEANQEESSSSASTRRKRRKSKDTPQELKAKKTARISRTAESVESNEGPATVTCKSCGEEGHSTKRSSDCRNHNFTLLQLLNRNLGTHQRYTMSITLDSFITNNDHAQPIRDKVIVLSSFLREVVFKAQLFINYYILRNVSELSTDLFDQDFWYRVCRVIYNRLTIQKLQEYYPSLRRLQAIYEELIRTDGVDLRVNLNDIQYYGAVVSSACKTLATTYNNYYVENFENLIANYFIHLIKVEFRNLSMKIIKDIVYDHLMDNLLIRQAEPLVIPNQILLENIAITAAQLSRFLNLHITPIRNRLPTIPMNKAILSKDPHTIIPALRYILNIYAQAVERHQQNQQQAHQQSEQREQSTQQQQDQQQDDQLEQFEQPQHTQQNSDQLGQDNQNQEQPANPDNTGPQLEQQNVILPRMFALFPSPSLKWRFIKIDGENIGFFFEQRSPKEFDETLIDYTRRLFAHFFNFNKFKIRGLEALINLPAKKGKMFLNTIYTDGYTRRVSFARRITSDPLDSVELSVSDFNLDEVDNHFRVCTIDPGRRDVFNSYHGDDDIRRLTTKEYYHESGSIKRMRNEDLRKETEWIKVIETNIPSVKTTSSEQFLRHVQYIMANMVALFHFYNFRVAEIYWRNFRGRQKALDHCSNILIHGSSKYNKERRKRKKMMMNRKKRRRMTNRRNPGITHQSIERNKTHRRVFRIGDESKMPLIVFGDGLKNKSSVRFRGLRHGVSERIYKHLRLKQKLGELYLLDINEYNTSQVCHSCMRKDMRYFENALGASIFSILVCNNCNIFWNGDVMAAKNMFYIAEEIWRGNGRPAIFSPQRRQTTTQQSATTNVVVPFSGERT